MRHVAKNTSMPPRTSDFQVGSYGYAWIFSMALGADFVLPLLALKPHKRLYVQRRFDALFLTKQGLQAGFHPMRCIYFARAIATHRACQLPGWSGI